MSYAEIRDWQDLSIGDHFIEDTFNEIYEVVETGLFDEVAGDDINNIKQCFGVKVIIVGYQVGNKVAPESQEPEIFNYDLDSPYGQPVYRVK